MTPRAQWAACFVAAPRADVLAAAQAVASRAEVRHLAVPRAGLYLLTLVDGALGEAFHVGEAPVSEALVEVAVDGRAARGGARLLADDAELAVAAAVLDAALAERLPGWPQAEAVLARGAAARAVAEDQRRALRERTRVDFRVAGEAEDA